MWKSYYRAMEVTHSSQLKSQNLSYNINIDNLRVASAAAADGVEKGRAEERKRSAEAAYSSSASSSSASSSRNAEYTPPKSPVVRSKSRSTTSSSPELYNEFKRSPELYKAFERKFVTNDTIGEEYIIMLKSDVELFHKCNGSFIIPDDIEWFALHDDYGSYGTHTWKVRTQKTLRLLNLGGNIHQRKAVFEKLGPVPDMDNPMEGQYDGDVPNKRVHRAIFKNFKTIDGTYFNSASDDTLDAFGAAEIVLKEPKLVLHEQVEPVVKNAMT